MKKLFAFLAIVLIVGFSIYKIGLPFLSEKIIDHVLSDYLTDDFVDEVLHFVEINNFDLNVDVETTSLPFRTKDEALKVILNEFSLKEMTDIANQLTDPNISEVILNDLVLTLSERFSKEEIEAFKVIGVNEIMNKKQGD